MYQSLFEPVTVYAVYQALECELMQAADASWQVAQLEAAVVQVRYAFWVASFLHIIHDIQVLGLHALWHTIIRL